MPLSLIEMFLKKNHFFSRSTKSQFFVIGPERELTYGGYSLNYYGLTLQVLFVQVLFGAVNFSKKTSP